jgi:DNA ligase-1
MKFSTVADCFARIESIDSRNEITNMLAILLRQATPYEASIIMYLALGLLQPPYKAHQFSFAQKSMIKCLAELFGESLVIVQEQVDKVGDVGSLFSLYPWHNDQTLKLTEVYDALVHFEAIGGVGSQEQKSIFFQNLLKQLDAHSAKYVVRMVLGTLRLGFSDMTLLDALSWMVSNDKSYKAILEGAYNRCADLGLIARVFKESGIEGINGIDITVGIPIRPAAADRLSDAHEIFEKLGPCVAQPKLDGFRVQVHLLKKHSKVEVHFFSRNLLDMSDMFPELVQVILGLPLESLIVEGEAIVYDPNIGQFLPFQETVKRKRKHGIEEAAQDYPLRLYLFDILYYNGVSMLGKTHTERRGLLDHVCAAIDHTIFPIEDKKISSEEELREYFLEQIGAGLEGIVVKKPDAIYQPGKRNSNWIKLKYHGDEKLNDTIDVVILGYYSGHGRRSAFGVGAFLVGIYNPENDKFETIAKVGTGMDDAQWVELKHKCDTYALSAQPHNVICHKNLAPKVWVDPKIVCEVLADEITVSPSHTAGKNENKLGIALRFPRFVRYRTDKNPEQTTTLEELVTLVKKEN